MVLISLSLPLILAKMGVCLMRSNFELTPSENSKYGIYFVVVMFACIMLYFGTIRSLSIDREALSSKMSLANTQLAELQTFVAQNQDYDALLKIQNLKLEQTKKKLPDRVSVPDLVGAYSKLADANGITLMALTPKNYTKVGIAFGLPLEMKLLGDYFNLINFLQQVENDDRFVNLQSTKFSVQKDGKLELTANFVVYALHDEVDATGANAAKNTKTQNVEGTKQK
jgi:Tfp pilus assembly protein PilO